VITVRYALWRAFSTPVRFEPPRPYVEVSLHTVRDSIYTQGLVDSGADAALFNAQIAEFLGLDVRSGQHKRTRGVGGTIDCWSHQIELEILGVRFAALVDFAPDWDLEFGLLGMRDLFAAFQVGIDQPGQRVLLNPALPPTEQ
jgi:hypothetical protein